MPFPSRVQRPSVAYVVVPEGLASEGAHGERTCLLSDYFEAVLERAVREVPQGATVYASPGNTFGCSLSEEDYGAAYIAQRRGDLTVAVPSYTRDRAYLDTFDNARVLREWLEREGRWPLDGSVTVYCNAPHVLRSYVLFTLCGFDVARVAGSRPATVRRRIVPRLWFYDRPVVQLAYEALGTVYGVARWIAWRVRRRGVSNR